MQITKNVKEVIGPVSGSLFFSTGTPVGKRLGEIQTAVLQEFRFLSGDDLKTSQISSTLNELIDLRDTVAHEFDRLAAPAEAFDPENLAKIVRWANERALGESRRGAIENRKSGTSPSRYVTNGQSITDTRGWNVVASLAPRYFVPKRTLVDALTKAISSEFEPFERAA
jgi:hypothetical protein